MNFNLCNLYPNKVDFSKSYTEPFPTYRIGNNPKASQYIHSVCDPVGKQHSPTMLVEHQLYDPTKENLALYDRITYVLTVDPTSSLSAV